MSISQAIETMLRMVPISAIVWGLGYAGQKLTVSDNIRAPRWVIRLCLIKGNGRGINAYLAALQIMACTMPFLKLTDRLTAPLLELPVPDTVFGVGVVAVFLIALLLLRSSSFNGG